jgi:hypothetical protein
MQDGFEIFEKKKTTSNLGTSRYLTVTWFTVEAKIVTPNLKLM